LAVESHFPGANGNKIEPRRAGMKDTAKTPRTPSSNAAKGFDPPYYATEDF
jgi:hypothetical protein